MTTIGVVESQVGSYANAMRLDFHCHSNASDGSLTPTKLAEAAREARLQWFALTDHDTFAGVDEAFAGLAPTISRMVACETTVRYYKHTLHVLTYVPHASARKALELKLAAVREARADRVIKIAGRLAKLGKPIEIGPLLEQAKLRPLGRPDLARVLVEAGYCKTEKQAFTRFLRDRGPADVPAETWTIGDLVECAAQEGLCLALAHPHTLGSFELVRELFQTYAAQGLRGIEAYYGPYGTAQRKPWLDLAQAFGLVVTGGSDFHGDLRPDIPSPGIDMPSEYSEPLLRWLEGARKV